ncbi:hypothetical protein A3748_10840 [Erythrobacter sp. HI0077]|nr:hypothetical protein A3745_02715 [Erythrobacter sp. HI0074]KZZ08687.1 hypothetical protein A3748_10840 [Erythrobacter sp. HI0077]
MKVIRRFTSRSSSSARTPIQTSPVRASVPTGISRQAKMNAPPNSLTRQSGGKIRPWFMNHQMIGISPIATVASVELS